MHLPKQRFVRRLRNHVRVLVCFKILLGLAFNPFSVARGDAALEGTKPAQWRVVWTEDPSTMATVSWSTAEKGKTHSLLYRQRGTTEPSAVQLADSGAYAGGELKLHYHHARLQGLEPSTAYEVQMVSDSELSPVLYFVTAPVIDRDFSLIHGGDSRSDREMRRRVNTMIAEIVERSYENEDLADDVIALAHGGDYIVSGKNMSLWSSWLSDHELTTASDGRMLPIIPARGNHDKGKPFNEVFGFTEDHLNYYSTGIGSRLQFITLNSEISTAGDQADWLREQLHGSRSKFRWLVAQYHRPVYPAVKAPAAGLKSWVPLFEQFDVDLVCEADGHNIKRTQPIRNNQMDPSGVVYIGEGGMGVPQRTPKLDRWYLESPGMADQGHHVFVLTFTENHLRGKCVLENGKIRDEFERPARR